MPLCSLVSRIDVDLSVIPFAKGRDFIVVFRAFWNVKAGLWNAIVENFLE